MGDVTDNEDEAPKKVEEEEDVSAPSSQEVVSFCESSTLTN